MSQDTCTLMQYQRKINKILKRKDISAENKPLFQAYVSLLKRSIYSACVKVKPARCKNCRNNLQGEIITLPCAHKICSNQCLLNLITAKASENNTRCYCKCNQMIPKHLVTKCLSFFEIYKETVPDVTCEICTNLKPISDFITFDCEHRYCRLCVNELLTTSIIEGKVGNKLSCPDCAKKIDHYTILEVIDEPTKIKYENFLLRSISANPNEVYLRCIGREGINCGYAEFISRDRDEYECSQCHAHFCVHCKLDVHPGLTCEQQKEINLTNNPYIKEGIKNGSMSLCPWCGEAIEKDSRGCKYITCKSSICKSKKFFCWDCKKKLNKFHEQHNCPTPEPPTRKCLIF